MFRKMFFSVSLIALFLLANFAAALPNSDDPGRKSEPEKNPVASASAKLMPLLPLDNTSPIAGGQVDFSWSEMDSAARYRLEAEDAHGKAVLSEMLPHGVGTHRMPAALLDAPTPLRWRVVAFDQAGKPLAETAWRILLPLSSECEMW
jgi:hypothetical protein